MSLRGRRAAVAIFKPMVWHSEPKHGAPARRISNISEIKMVGFIAKPTIYVSLRGRRAAVAIFKPKAWHPVAKHGSTKQQNPQISDRHGATSQLRFSGSAISRGRKPAFPVRSIFHTVKDRISRRSSGRASFRDAVSFRQRLPRRAQKMRPPRNDKSDRVCWKTKRFSERNA